MWMNPQQSDGVVDESTTEMIADIFTKPLAKVKIEEFRRMLGLE